MFFTGKQHLIHKCFFRGTYLQRISVVMQNFKFSSITVLAVQLFNKIKQQKKMKKTKNLKKHVSLYFPDVMSKYLFIFFGEFILFCMFRH